LTALKKNMLMNHRNLLLIGGCLLAGIAHAEHPAVRTIQPDNAYTVQRESAVRGKFPALKPRTITADGHPNTAHESSESAAVVPGSIVTIASSLAVVLGLFAGLVWISRKFGGGVGNERAIPKEVVQKLGSTMIDARTRLTMVRCGDRILVLTQNATQVQSIAEITAPEEVRQITAACLGDAKQAFMSTLKSIEQEPAARGFIAAASEPPTPRSRGRLFASA
jgi:flagellar biogenesis protein FliO